MVFRIAYSILRNHHDAEDATQECFLKVLKLVQKSKTGLEQVRNPKTWLARVAWTTALDRRSGRSAVRDHELVAEDSTVALDPERLDVATSVDRFPDERHCARSISGGTGDAKSSGETDCRACRKSCASRWSFPPSRN